MHFQLVVMAAILATARSQMISQVDEISNKSQISLTGSYHDIKSQCITYLNSRLSDFLNKVERNNHKVIPILIILIILDFNSIFSMPRMERQATQRKIFSTRYNDFVHQLTLLELT